MSSVCLTDSSLPLRGRFSFRVKDASGRVVYEYADPNMIVNAARVALSRLVSSGDPAKVISGFAVGTGGAVATPADTELTGAYSTGLVRHEFPSEGVVKFCWRLGYDEANGMDIREFGLLCADNTLFARKTREAIHKDADLSFDGEWSILF